MIHDSIRNLTPDDYEQIAAAADSWWGGRPMRSLCSLVPRFLFEHFGPTSFAIGAPGEVTAFLIGFVSQADPTVAYIHFVGVDPVLRGGGVGRALYERFFKEAHKLGRSEVRCITSPVNTGSVEFHKRMGFEVLAGTGEVSGVPVVLDHSGPGEHRVAFRKLL